MELLERNRRLLFGKNPWVSAAAALWLASLKRLGLLKRLAEAAGTTTVSIRKAAGRMKVRRFGRLSSTSPHCFCMSSGVWVVKGASWLR